MNENEEESSGLTWGEVFYRLGVVLAVYLVMSIGAFLSANLLGIAATYGSVLYVTLFILVMRLVFSFVSAAQRLFNERDEQ
jgi:hypothetical protein